MLQHGDRRHTVEEGQRIIGLASRLQNAEMETLSRQELEQAAAEMGIEPAFVRQAIAQLEDEPESQGQPTVPVLVFGMLVIAQWLAAFTAMTGNFTDWRGAHLWVLAGFSFALGLAAVSRRSRAMTSLSVLASFVIVTALCGGWVYLTGGEVDSNWLTYIKNLALGQMLLTLLGGLIGRVIRRLTPRSPQAVEPTS